MSSLATDLAYLKLVGAADTAAKPARRPIVATTNILISEGKILLGLRADCELWETPGGKVEAEFVEDCARREMLEETGMRMLGAPKVIGYTDGWEWSGKQGKDWYVVVHFAWSSWYGFPRLVEGKHLAWDWWPVDDLPELCRGTAAFAKNILPEYLKSLR